MLGSRRERSQREAHPDAEKGQTEDANLA